MNATETTKVIESSEHERIIFTVYDIDADAAAIDATYERIYGLAFMMLGDEAQAERLQLDTMAAAADAVRALRFNCFPAYELFNRIVDAQFIHELEKSLTGFGTLTLHGRCEAPNSDLYRQAKLPEIQQAVLTLPPTERFIYLLHFGLGYRHEDVSRLLRITREISAKACCHALVEIRESIARGTSPRKRVN